ncbi:MAG: hypothetical protein RIQ93_602 [Verrucomicrobiota bacterium]|jgi:paraquat-inducible protein A
MSERWQLHQRASCARTAAFAVAAGIMLVPANVLPVLTTSISGHERTDTIFSATVGLCEDGLWALGAIVFIASLAIPFLKLLGLGWLLLAAKRGPGSHSPKLTRLYSALDIIGRWSMLDVFLAAFLTGVVQFGSLARVQPRAGIAAFAAAVVLTMLATRSFDPRILWKETAAEPALSV